MNGHVNHQDQFYALADSRGLTAQIAPSHSGPFHSVDGKPEQKFWEAIAYLNEQVCAVHVWQCFTIMIVCIADLLYCLPSRTQHLLIVCLAYPNNHKLQIDHACAALQSLNCHALTSLSSSFPSQLFMMLLI